MEGINANFLNADQLPLVIQPSRAFSKQEFFDFISSQQTFFKQKFLKYGGILFRGFPLQTAEDFATFIRYLGMGKFVDYIGGDSPRNKIKDGVYTSTEAPPSIKIPLHNELSFVKYHPKHIYFFCEMASNLGGSTIIADARKIYQSVDSRIRQKFIDKSLRYISSYYHKGLIMDGINKFKPFHKSWIQVFETESKEEVEKKCHEHEFEYQWIKNEWIRISQVRPAVKAHPETGELVWFNQAHLYDFNPRLLGTWNYLAAKLFYCRKHTKLHEIFFADHTSIPKNELYHVMNILDQHTIAFPWQKGDALVLDNVLTMHGREPFKGKRRVLAAMTS